MATHREVERKFDVRADVDLADVLPGLPDHEHTRGQVASVAERRASRLVATYLDTSDLDLARAGATLRRRTGGSDAGWHLKLRTAADERLEVRRPLGRTSKVVPPALLDQVRAVVRDRPLTTVAVVTTERVERDLRDAEGKVLAVVADDTVRATRTDRPAEEQAWREVEVELVAGDRDLLDAVGRALCSHGLAPSESSSKLSRVLGSPQRSSAQAGLRAGTAGHALHQQLVSLVSDAGALDRAARAGDVEGVHQLRVTVRRLRTALAVHRPLLDRRRTEPLRDELEWLGRQLAPLRDLQVADRRISAALAGLSPDQVRGPVRRRVAREVRARERAASAALREAMCSTRYYRLLDALDDLLQQPPYSRLAGRPAGAVLRKRTRRTVQRVRQRMQPLDGEQLGSAEHSRRLHDLRKAVRRVRYAAEGARGELGTDAARLGRKMHAAQDELGEHQDSVTTRRLLKELAREAGAAGESEFTYGVLAGIEAERGRASRERFPELLRKALAQKSTGWLG